MTSCPFSFVSTRTTNQSRIMLFDQDTYPYRSFLIHLCTCWFTGCFVACLRSSDFTRLGSDHRSATVRSTGLHAIVAFLQAFRLLLRVYDVTLKNLADLDNDTECESCVRFTGLDVWIVSCLFLFQNISKSRPASSPLNFCCVNLNKEETAVCYQKTDNVIFCKHT